MSSNISVFAILILDFAASDGVCRALKVESGHPTEEAYFSHLYPRSGSCGPDSYPMTVDEGQDIYWLVKRELSSFASTNWSIFLITGDKTYICHTISHSISQLQKKGQPRYLISSTQFIQNYNLCRMTEKTSVCIWGLEQAGAPVEGMVGSRSVKLKRYLPYSLVCLTVFCHSWGRFHSKIISPTIFHSSLFNPNNSSL